MISKLTGIVDSIREGRLILDVGGVGYGVSAPAPLLARVVPGAPLSLWIETMVREDAITLYGFGTPAEHEFFLLLTSVQGVGPKAALSVLSGFEPARLASLVMSGDAKSLSAAPGVGPKTAARIISELKDKVAKAAIGLKVAGIGREAAAPAVSEDALSALAHLGYPRAEAFEAVMAALAASPDMPLDELVKSALRRLGRL